MVAQNLAMKKGSERLFNTGPKSFKFVSVVELSWLAPRVFHTPTKVLNAGGWHLGCFIPRASVNVVN